MKKTTILSLIVVAAIITSCAVSGTYAKYSTSESITDKARVAEWDITIGDVENIDLFKKSYMIDVAGNEYSYVDAAAKVVAPGTSGEYKFTIGGTAEVNYRLGLSLGADSYNKVKLANGYDPLRFSYQINDSTASGWMTFDELKTALASNTSEKVYAAGETADASITIKWQWAFDSEEADYIDDAMDTKLALSNNKQVMLVIGVSAVQTKDQADSQKTVTPEPTIPEVPETPVEGNEEGNQD